MTTQNPARRLDATARSEPEAGRQRVTSTSCSGSRPTTACDSRPEVVEDRHGGRSSCEALSTSDSRKAAGISGRCIVSAPRPRHYRCRKRTSTPPKAPPALGDEDHVRRQGIALPVTSLSFFRLIRRRMPSVQLAVTQGDQQGDRRGTNDGGHQLANRVFSACQSSA